MGNFLQVQNFKCCIHFRRHFHFRRSF